MTRVRLVPLAVLLALAAGCGGGTGRVDATLWVTRDRGAAVMHEERVGSGATGAQALEGVAKVKTRYGGAFVQGIDGVEGGGSRDWFFYVNGYIADRGGADYLLHPGDVEWWDFRRWDAPNEAPLVVGAFPEPFLHGYDGKTRPAAVRYSVSAQAQGARALGRLLHASVARVGVPVPAGANELRLVTGAPRFRIRYRAGHGSAGDPVLALFAGDAVGLAQDPHRFRFRYSVP